MLGADHHGYIARLRAALAALGVDPERLEVSIMQLVHVVEGGERAQMSKRKGEFVTLDELIDDIGVDAARFFMLQRSHDTAVDLDLDLARAEPGEPGLLRPVRPRADREHPAQGGRGRSRRAAEAADLARGRRAGRALRARAGQAAAASCPTRSPRRPRAARPHRLCAYATRRRADFHAFYRDCQVVGAEGEGVEDSRLAICLLAKRDDRPHAGAARDQRPGEHVGRYRS